VAPPPVSDLLTQLDTLHAWLEADSLDAATLWGQLQPLVHAWNASTPGSPSVAELVDAISRYISRFDHDLALHALADLHTQISSSVKMG
jgi:hypothetical protein